jgi:hypothetical protein
MEQFSRAYAHVIRSSLKLLKLDLGHMEQLQGGLYPTKVNFTKLDVYSEAMTIESVNKRDKFSEGFFFTQRFLISLEDIEVDTHTGICHHKGRIIDESSLWGAQYLLLTAIPRPISPKKLNLPNDVTPIVLPSIGYFHWLTEELGPFLFTVSKTRNPIVLYNENAPRYVKDFLEDLPLNSLAVPRFVSLKRINFVTKPNQIGWSHKKDLEEVIEFFKTILCLPVPKKRLYISRTKSTRSPKFELALIRELEERDWVILNLEEISFEEQIKLISSAEVICGIAGAGLANAIWLSKKSRVIEIAPERFSSSITKVCENLKIRHDIIFYENDCNEHQEILLEVQKLIDA